jgi:hypothetical protein
MIVTHHKDFAYQFLVERAKLIVDTRNALKGSYLTRSLASSPATYQVCDRPTIQQNTALLKGVTVPTKPSAHFSFDAISSSCPRTGVLWPS